MDEDSSTVCHAAVTVAFAPRAHLVRKAVRELCPRVVLFIHGTYLDVEPLCNSSFDALLLYLASDGRTKQCAFSAMRTTRRNKGIKAGGPTPRAWPCASYRLCSFLPLASPSVPSFVRRAVALVLVLVNCSGALDSASVIAGCIPVSSFQFPQKKEKAALSGGKRWPCSSANRQGHARAPYRQLMEFVASAPQSSHK
jgi:hypothetical protein